MSRKVCITSVDGQTGFLIAELLLTDERFSSKIDSLVGLAMDPSSPKAKELATLGGTVLPHIHGRERDVIATLKKTGCDTLCLIPPAHPSKFDISIELANAAKKSGTVQNVLLISSAGCDYAERDQQPRLREFIDIESAVLSTKGDAKTPAGHSPCVIRAGFYAENLLLYSQQARNEGIMPLPIGENHKFAPIALGVSSIVFYRLEGGLLTRLGCCPRRCACSIRERAAWLRRQASRPNDGHYGPNALRRPGAGCVSEQGAGPDARV